jgi:hypothetical protein
MYELYFEYFLYFNAPMLNELIIGNYIIKNETLYLLFDYFIYLDKISFYKCEFSDSMIVHIDTVIKQYTEQGRIITIKIESEKSNLIKIY